LLAALLWAQPMESHRLLCIAITKNIILSCFKSKVATTLPTTGFCLTNLSSNRMSKDHYFRLFPTVSNLRGLVTAGGINLKLGPVVYCVGGIAEGGIESIFCSIYVCLVRPTLQLMSYCTHYLYRYCVFDSMLACIEKRVRSISCLRQHSLLL
jgi:hypothetical protein